MALPELMLPPGFPDFKADTYEYTPGKSFKPVDRAGGVPRRRALHLNPPAMAKAELELSQQQLEAFFAWHEGPLRAGEQPFTARVPKFGAGVAYQEARCLSFEVEHREGVNNHLLVLSLRLRGEPSDTAPAVSSMLAEVSLALLTNFSGAEPQDLFSECLVSLNVTALQGEMLVSDALCALATEFAGPITDPSMAAEAALGLVIQVAVIASEEFLSEVSLPLLTGFLDQADLAAEAALPLSGTFAGVTGYIVSPANITYSVFRPRYPGLPAAFTVLVGKDGGVFTRVDSGGFSSHALWHSPLQLDVGAGLWVKATKLSTTGTGIIDTGEGYATWLSLASDRSWRSSVFGTAEASEQNFSVQVALDPDGVTVVSSFEVNLTFDIYE